MVSLATVNPGPITASYQTRQFPKYTMDGVLLSTFLFCFAASRGDFFSCPFRHYRTLIHPRMVERLRFMIWYKKC
jgi:hypothetical protein